MIKQHEVYLAVDKHISEYEKDKDSVHPIFVPYFHRNIVDSIYLRKYSELSFVNYKNSLNLLKWLKLFKINLTKTYTKQFVLINDKILYDLLKGIGHNSLLINFWNLFPFTLFHYLKKKFATHVNYYTGASFVIGFYKLFLFDLKLESSTAHKMFGEIVALFEKVKPEFLIISNDTDPLTRLFIDCAKYCKVKTICVQHGLIKERDDFLFNCGNYCDYYFVWGDSIKKIFIDNNIESERVHVLGYPLANSINHKTRLNKKKILLIGEGFGYCNSELDNLVLEIYQNINKLLQQQGYHVYYKPHPSTDYSAYRKIGFRIINSSFEKCIKKFDVFIGLVSSVLLEVSLNNKIGIQIYNERFPGDNYFEKKYCYSILFEKLSALATFIDSIDKSYEVPTSSILSNHNVAKKFYELINVIEQ